MNRMLRRMAGLTMMLVAAATIPASAQTGDRVSAVTVALHGRFGLGGEFTGSATVNRIELGPQGNSLVAVGLVKGTLRRGNRTFGTVVGGEVKWPVLLRVNGSIAPISGPSAPLGVMPVGWALAQGEICPVLQIALAPVTVNLLGVDVTLSPVALDLRGDSSTPLGALVCEVGRLLGNVAGLVGVLNNILGLITGLLGGLLP